MLSFNWAATALASILVQLFVVCTTHFYDDYNVVEFSSLVASADVTVSAVFKLLGWATKPLPPFSSSPEPLGAVVDLTRFNRGTVKIANKRKRVEEIVEIIDKALAADKLSFEAMRTLRGRLVHARAQTFGNVWGAALLQLGKFLLGAVWPAVFLEIVL